MTHTEEKVTNPLEAMMGSEMSTITFGELVHQITGVPFDEIYKDYLIHGDSNESNME